MGSARASPRRVLILCTAAYASIYVARLNLSVASPLLEQGGIMTKMGIGLMGSVFFAVYAAGRFVNGYAGDALSPKKLLAAGLAVVAASNICIGLLPPAAAIVVLWGVNGLAQSMLWGPSLRLVNEAYADSPFRRRAAVVLSAGIGIGSLLALVLASALSGTGVRAVFIVPGLVALAAALMATRLPRSAGKPVRPDWRQTLSLFKKRDILCLLFPAAAHGAVKENLVLWAPLLFMEAYGIDLGAAAAYAFLMPGAMLLGRVAYPLLERLGGGDERRVSVCSFALCAACLAPFFIGELPVPLAAALLALAALAVSVVNVAFMAVHPLRYRDSNQVSMAAGLLDGASYIGSAAGSVLFGWLIVRYGYLSMIGVYAAICLISIGSMLPGLPRKNQTIK